MKTTLIATLILFLVLGVSLVATSGVQAADKIVIKYADQVAEGHPAVLAAHLFGKRMAELTKNRVQVEVYPNSALGSLREYMEGIQLGTIQMGMTTSANMEVYSKKFMLASLPYAFKSDEQAMRIMQGKVGRVFNEEAEKAGFKIVAFYFEGPRNFFTTKKPITTPEDLKGLKIRVMESPMMRASIDAMGATAVPMAFGELYLALKTGVVDGGEVTPLIMENMKFYEVAKYYSLTQHFNNANFIMIGKKFFDGLPKDIQDAVVKVSHEAWEVYAMKKRDEILAAALNNLKAQGVKVNVVDTAPFAQKSQSVYTAFEKEIGKDLLDEILQAK